MLSLSLKQGITIESSGSWQCSVAYCFIIAGLSFMLSCLLNFSKLRGVTSKQRLVMAA